MLASGIHPKIASERLGHSKVGITLDLYSHVLPGVQEEAAIKVDTLISAALLHRQKSGRSQSGSKTGFSAMWRRAQDTDKQG